MNDGTQLLKKRFGLEFQLRGQYLGEHRIHRFRCNVCLNTWKCVFSELKTCPFCTGLKRARAVKGRYQFKVFAVDGCSFRVQGYEQMGIEWILKKNPKIKAKDIRVDSSGKVPTIPYKIGRRNRIYYPDIFLPKLNRIVEIKSAYTVGLTTGKHWRRNQQKAKAVLAAGYKFTVLVLKPRGTPIKLPPDWYMRTRASVLEELGL